MVMAVDITIMAGGVALVHMYAQEPAGEVTGVCFTAHVVAINYLQTISKHGHFKWPCFFYKLALNKTNFFMKISKF
jgi:hypothetical protein